MQAILTTKNLCLSVMKTNIRFFHSPEASDVLRLSSVFAIRLTILSPAASVTMAQEKANRSSRRLALATDNCAGACERSRSFWDLCGALWHRRNSLATCRACFMSSVLYVERVSTLGIHRMTEDRSQGRMLRRFFYTGAPLVPCERLVKFKSSSVKQANSVPVAGSGLESR